MCSAADPCDNHLQGLANICWSFGRLRHPCEALLQALAPHAAASVWEFNAQVLRLHAFQLRLHENRLQLEVASRCSVLKTMPSSASTGQNMTAFAQGIANLCYGFAVLQQPLGPELSSAIVDAFGKRYSAQYQAFLVCIP